MRLGCLTIAAAVARLHYLAPMQLILTATMGSLVVVVAAVNLTAVGICYMTTATAVAPPSLIVEP